ncbi:MAG: toll/interleukin-1 receptor domain-containing protein, partial [Lachnospiraceae bacterium]|nr:toll/interleukin-1 receptor domain-containing protein [Lachnospiraceae bacterium]
MIEHYDAFISYRHAKLDTEIAESVQNDLEHFRIPRAVRRSSGKKRIERIFRDREELPITSDLNDNITFALKNSDFLIVICSTRTKESKWVEREIEAFLKYHDRNRILTVLADGDPSDVIPKVLRFSEEPVIREDGSIVLEMVEMEPLACDYWMKRSAARKKELPRLAASILGCSYDELILRRRQYRMRQLTAAVSVFAIVMSAASVYMYRTGQKIKNNLEAAQINQSVYLAN